MTIVEHITAATVQLDLLRGSDRDQAAREFSLAITALEDAQMRATRGLAMRSGVFNPADLQKEN
jgi:hypothetical protein